MANYRFHKYILYHAEYGHETFVMWHRYIYKRKSNSKLVVIIISTIWTYILNPNNLLKVDSHASLTQFGHTY